MLVLSNHSADYRNWAYCCVAIRELTEKLNSYAAGKVTDVSEYYRIKSSGRNAYNDYCSRKCQKISRRLARYICLQEKLAAGLDSPEALPRCPCPAHAPDGSGCLSRHRFDLFAFAPVS